MSLADMGTVTRSTGGGGGGAGGGGGGAGLGGSRHYDLSNAGGGGAGGGRMTHSLSTPSGVDGTPSTPRHRGGKKLTVRIQMLDDSVTMFQVQAKALGRVLFEQVCRQLNLLEADYFGLEYQEISTHTKYWLDLEKPMNRQVGLSLIDPVLRFCIKFYTPDPAQLEEEYTRYLFCLQIKRDLATGSLQCNDNTAALMASYIVQASCGDYVPEDYPDHTYLSSYRFVPHQDATMQRKIMENHKKHFGQSPAEADLNLLETARRCELYGMKMHPAKDVEGVPLNLAVAHMGITVFQNITRINTFSWAKIRKISFKRKRFLVKLHPEGYGYYKDTVEFFFEGRNECKNFWKKCVENHGFFRCTAVQNTPRRKTRVLSRGSSFRYSGKTQKQIIEFVRENYVKRQNFQRSQSFRQGPLNASSRSQSHTYVNSSISANPLLPIDTATWDYRNQCSDSMTPSLTKKAADTLDRRRDNPTDHMRSQVTAAQVEIYQTKNYAAESPTSAEEAGSSAERQHHSAVGMDQMNSNRSLSPQGPQSWTSPSHSSSQQPQRAPDLARAHPGDHNLDVYHGINGNMSLDRRGEIATPPSRYDLTLGSDKSSSLSRSEAGTYDIIQAEIQHAKRQELATGVATAHNGHNGNGTSNGNGNVGPAMSSNMHDIEAEVKKRKWPTEPSYFLAKELLMTERTYKKDLDVLNTSFRQVLSLEDVQVLQPLFELLDSLAQHHNLFLRDIEHRMVLWEGRGNRDTHRIGDVMLKHMGALPIYEEYVQTHLDILHCMNDMYESDQRFQRLYKEFEQQKVCYLPIGELLLKPLNRLLHYQLLLERFCDYYDEEHLDSADCLGVYHLLIRSTKQVRAQLPDSANFVELCELQRDISFEQLVQPHRRLIRQGCLLKHSKRGLQQRMFFLFSDILLYGSKSPLDQSFRILGHVPVRSLLTENAEHNTFSIFGGQCAITVSAGTTAEKTLWLAELSKAAADIKNRPPNMQLQLTTLKNCSSSEEGLDLVGLSNGTNSLNSSVGGGGPLTPQQLQMQQQNKTQPSRSNTALHVCWHRGATVGLGDHLIAAEHQLSGYLLRKFKNSSGWQKLWVVFTSFCLYFYKSYQDEFALASLPLLGYTVGPPGHQDAVQKEFVFKLSFKNHVYFFRAESAHTYNRWLEVLRSTTQTQDFKNVHSHASNN